MPESATAGPTEDLTRRALRLVLDRTTELADAPLRVPLHYYRDPKLTEVEESQILRRTPLAVMPPSPHCSTS